MFKTFFVTNIGKASFFFCKKEAIAVQFLFVFIEKKSLQCEVSFAIHDMHHQPRARVFQALFTLLMDAREYPGIGWSSSPI